MLKDKILDLINANFSHFRLEPIKEFKGIKNNKFVFESLPLIKGIYIKQKAKFSNMYFIVGIIKPNGEDIIYEDFLFRTFELKGKKFNEFKELVGYAKDLIELYRKANY